MQAFPVVRNGGVDMYYLDKDPLTLADYAERSPAGWGYGDQAFPSMSFYNSYHGIFAPIDHNVFSKSADDCSLAYANYPGHTHGYYSVMAKEYTDIEPLVQNASFDVLYNGNLRSYLNVPSTTEYIIFGKYKDSNNTVAGGTGKVTFNLLPIDGNYDSATIATDTISIDSQHTKYPDDHGKKDDNGRYIGDKTAVALYVPQTAGQRMTTYLVFPHTNYKGTETQLSVEGDTTHCGEIIKMKFKTGSENIVPTGLRMRVSQYEYGKNYDIVKPGALKALSPDEDGYYTVEAILPYYPFVQYEVVLEDKTTSIGDDTKVSENIYNAYIKSTKEEVANAILTEEEKDKHLGNGDVHYKLTGKGIGEVPEAIRKKFKKAAGNKGYELSAHYMDLSVQKRLDFGEYQELGVLPGGEITIAIQMPDKYSDIREYKVLRLHDGKYDVLDAAFDRGTNELTFNTDRFSTYVLAYKDIKSPGTGDY